MQASFPWQSWRSIVLPAVESILGRPLTHITTRYIHPTNPRSIKIRHARQFSCGHLRAPNTHENEPNAALHKEIRERKLELDRSGIEQYPRVPSEPDFSNITIEKFNKKFEALQLAEKSGEHEQLRLSGRLTSIRKSGSKLAFLDICEEPGHHKVQLVMNLGEIPIVDKKTFSNHIKLITRGDVVSASGRPYRTSAGELSLLLDGLPKILSACLHRMPLTSYQSEMADEMDVELPDRHVEMLTDPSVISVMAARAKLIQTMRRYFDENKFIEVQTPILAGAAGGATARPFETTATEFLDRKLSLRIAPELWLKRLVVGGLPRVYEIGPSFRNEGLDRTHNPEFTTCEFYSVYQTLSQLQRITETILRHISAAIQDLSDPNLSSPNPEIFAGEFPSVDFIPALNTALGTPLPNLTTPTAYSELINIFNTNSIPIPSKPTLPRLLDKLSARYLEPQCNRPTWIINTPECMSPLAKSFIHLTCPNNQPVAARAELFINNRELVNCYEEENSPFEQRRKFIDQQRFAKLDESGVDDEAHSVDEDYLRALEWGLPPTGGWGCGIDRLVMLFTGRERISDVLSFGSLRAVTRGAEKLNVREKGEK